MRLRDLLDRFRPAGAPGAPAPAGVPADQLAQVEAELAPVLAAVAVTERRAARLVREAHDEARRRRALDAAAAAVVTARAREQAAAERADAAARVRAGARAEAARAEEAGALRAQEVVRTAAARRDEHVAQVVAAVRELLDAPAGTSRGAPASRRADAP